MPNGLKQATEFITPEVLELLEVMHNAKIGTGGKKLLQDTTAPALPTALAQRRVELVVSANEEANIEAGLLVKPDAIVLDFDDTFSPTWQNVVLGHQNFKNLCQTFAAGSPLLMIRPRGLHLLERRIRRMISTKPVNAGLFDVAVALTNAKKFLHNGGTLYIYIAKPNGANDARAWAGALRAACKYLKVPSSQLRVGIQIETQTGALASDAMVKELSEFVFCLNAGRWDYVFSLVKHAIVQNTSLCFPERERLTMDQDFLRAYARRIVGAAKRANIQAVGGTAALIPEKHNLETVLASVRSDKLREASQGFCAAWAGHPALVGTVRDAFDLPARVPSETEPDDDKSLLEFPIATSISEMAIRKTLRVGLHTLSAWLAGVGWVALDGRSEDTATAELARAQLWQWLNCNIKINESQNFSTDLYVTWRDEELKTLERDNAKETASFLDELVLNEHCPEYFPRLGMARIV